VLHQVDLLPYLPALGLGLVPQSLHKFLKAQLVRGQPLKLGNVTDRWEVRLGAHASNLDHGQVVGPSSRLLVWVAAEIGLLPTAPHVGLPPPLPLRDAAVNRPLALLGGLVPGRARRGCCDGVDSGWRALHEGGGGLRHGLRRLQLQRQLQPLRHWRVGWLALEEFRSAPGQQALVSDHVPEDILDLVSAHDCTHSLTPHHNGVLVLVVEVVLLSSLASVCRSVVGRQGLSVF